MLIEVTVPDHQPMRLVLPQDCYMQIHGVEIRTGKAVPEPHPCPACKEKRTHSMTEWSTHHPVSVTTDNTGNKGRQ